MTDSTVVSARSGVVSTTLDDEEVLLNMASGKYFGLNEVGTHIWKTIQRPTAVQDICKAVREEYDVDEAACRKDVYDLLTSLNANGLVETRDESD